MKGRMALFLLVFIFLAGCASTGFPPETGEEAQKVNATKRIEISLAPGSFAVEEVEFHVDASKIPPAIIRKAKEEMPNGQIQDCEIEYHGGAKYYEVTCSMGGKEQEVMFTEDGEVHRWEMEVGVNEVDRKALEAAKKAIDGGMLNKAEHILDGDKNLLEYHFKMEKFGMKYKVAVSTEGEVIQVYREAIGEIEVPVK